MFLLFDISVYCSCNNSFVPKLVIVVLFFCILRSNYCRQPSLWLQDLCQEVLTVWFWPRHSPFFYNNICASDKATLGVSLRLWRGLVQDCHRNHHSKFKIYRTIILTCLLDKSFIFKVIYLELRQYYQLAGRILQSPEYLAQPN